MSKLIKSIEKKQNVGFTENLARSNRSTLNACLDLFGKIGAMRNMSERDTLSYFTKAFSEDPQTALRILFYARDIRGGQGERSVFRKLLNYLGDSQWRWVSENVHLIPEYGRWDDLYALEGTRSFDAALGLIKGQFEEDLVADRPSVLGKWMKSINTSSKESRRLGEVTRKALGLSAREYRKALSGLRDKIGVLEQKLCAGAWDDIDYESVPSRAAMILRNAFRRHDEKGYQAYLDAVEAGDRTIKTATLYPYDLVEKALYGQSDRTINLQWDNLPNYVEPFNGLVVADTSGSMSGRPMAVAVSLAMYIAERNEGRFKNYFLTFSERPELQKIQGANLTEKAMNLSSAGWGFNTNLQAVFKTILNAAVADELPQSEMPEVLFIVSDMQFDQACSSNKRTNLEQIRKRYEQAGYQVPHLVFWNVRGVAGDSPITVDDNGTALVSGCSPSILKSVLAREIITPMDVMYSVINTPRYEAITI